MFLFNIKVIIFESLKSLYLMNNNSSHTQEQTAEEYVFNEAGNLDH